MDVTTACAGRTDVAHGGVGHAWRPADVDVAFGEVRNELAQVRGREQALPYLTQEVLQAQFNPNIDMVGGATATSFAFEQSLQAALLQASKI